MVREDATHYAVLFAVTDVRTSVAHLVTDGALTIRWRLGSYVTCPRWESLALACVRWVGDLR